MALEPYVVNTTSTQLVTIHPLSHSNPIQCNAIQDNRIESNTREEGVILAIRTAVSPAVACLLARLRDIIVLIIMAAKQKAGAPSPSLSKGLMNLKFMQRQKEAELRKQLEAEQQKKAHESHWEVAGASAGPSCVMLLLPACLLAWHQPLTLVSISPTGW